jgi:hypothetical protein
VYYAAYRALRNASKMFRENSAVREFLDVIGAANAEDPLIAGRFGVNR